MSPAVRKDGRLVLGGSPRADLLPPEIKLAEKSGAQRRVMGFVLIGVVAAVVLGYVLVSFTAQSAQDRFVAANRTTDELLAEQAKYIEVRQLNTQVQASKDARLVGTSTEVNWKTYIDQVSDLLPKGVEITAVRATAASPVLDFPVATAPLEGYRIGQLDFTAESKDIPDVAAWIEALRELPGFVDATPSAVTAVSDVYAAEVTIHFNAGALANRFAVVEEVTE